MELYRPEEEFHAFFTTGPVVAFRVDNVDAARAAMEAAGIQFIGPIQRSGKTSWNHFRAPDGTVFEILSESDGHDRAFTTVVGRVQRGIDDFGFGRDFGCESVAFANV